MPQKTNIWPEPKQLPATRPCTGNIALQTRGGARRR